MEQIAAEVAKISETMQTSSGKVPTTSGRSTGPTENEALGLFALINRARALNGWKAKEAKDLEPTMLMWWERFKAYHIPVEAYKEIFDMAFDVRMSAMSKGEEAPVIEAALLVSCWTRPHGVKAMREQRAVELGRTLTDSAKSQCERCFGTGQENFFDIDGRIIGAGRIGECEHKPLDRSMFKPPAANVVPIGGGES